MTNKRKTGGRKNFAPPAPGQMPAKKYGERRCQPPGALKSLICCLLGIKLAREAWEGLPTDKLAEIVTDIEYEEA